MTPTLIGNLLARVEVSARVESPGWEGTDIEQLVETAALATLNAVGESAADYQISVLACDDDRIADLNSRFRNRPQITDILSWPSVDSFSAAIDEQANEIPSMKFLGDLAISWTCCRRDADLAGRNFNDHLTHLLVHGVLHLLGFEHSDGNSAKKMEEIEIRVLATLNIIHPYTLQPDENARSC